MESKTTGKLQEANSSCNGVTKIVIDQHETFQIVQDQRTHEFTGPATIIVTNQEYDNLIKMTLSNQGTLKVDNVTKGLNIKGPSEILIFSGN